MLGSEREVATGGGGAGHQGKEYAGRGASGMLEEVVGRWSPDGWVRGLENITEVTISSKTATYCHVLTAARY